MNQSHSSTSTVHSAARYLAVTVPDQGAAETVTTVRRESRKLNVLEQLSSGGHICITLSCS